jgi:RsiW-degrading membrane proteinase PrsW (M82 family)
MLIVVVAILPVLAFLALLFLMDSFKLVRRSAIATAIVAGASAALLSWIAFGAIAPATDSPVIVRYIAPISEEILKASFVVVLLVRRRLGFLVDAAVQGFAVGAGFAVVENAAYLGALGDRSLPLWLVRGFGTAILHGATTALFAMITKNLLDRRTRAAVAFLPGLLVAIAIHSLFNHAVLPPVFEALLLLVALPLLVAVVFERSERATREWVGAGMDLDIELLALVSSDAFAFTRFAQYLQELRARFPGTVVADMFCLLRVDLELAVQAKAMLLAREAGLEIPVDDDLRAGLAEREYLKRSIGHTGLLALRPLQITSDRDDWHRYLLAQAGRN